MALQDLGIGIVIGGALASSFKSSFKFADKSLAGIHEKVNALNQTKLDIQSFRRLSKDATANKKELDKLGISLKKAGVDVRNIDADARLLRTALVHLKKAAKIDIKLTSNKEAFAEQKAAIVGIGASLYGVTNIIQSANNVLKSQGEIRSLGISAEGIDAITQAGLEMSLQYGQITAPAFIQASYDIKSGIASLSDEGVKDFTRFAATTATATKSSVAEMTKLYALGYGIFRQDFTSDVDFGKQFSGAIAGAVQAFRTDGADLAAGISNIGASAKAMGVSLQEELAIIGLSKGAFASASEAGSGYRAFLDGAGKAQEKLGLQFTDSQGKLLPMSEILSLIQSKYGDLQLAEIDELKTAFGSTEAIKTITALLPKIDALKQAKIGLEKNMMGGLSLGESMANAMDSGYGFEKMGNAMSYLSFTIGKAVAPAIDVLASGLGHLAKGIAWMDNKIPFLVPVFSGLAMGILGLVVTLKVATLSKLAFEFATLSLRKSILISSASNLYHAMTFNRIGMASMLAKGKLLAFSAASKLAAGTQWLLNAAMTANPIGLMVAGIAALAAGVVYAYQNFEPFTAFVDGLWTKLKRFFSFALEGFKSIGNMVSGIAGFFGFGEETKTAKTSSKPAKASALGAAMLAPTLAIASPMPSSMIQPVSMPVQQPSMVQAKQLAPQPIHNTSQHFNIKVVVQNPASNVDVEQAIVAAMRQQHSSVPLADEDI